MKRLYVDTQMMEYIAAHKENPLFFALYDCLTQYMEQQTVDAALQVMDLVEQISELNVGQIVFSDADNGGHIGHA
jgi:hypothetical protein